MAAIVAIVVEQVNDSKFVHMRAFTPPFHHFFNSWSLAISSLAFTQANLHGLHLCSGNEHIGRSQLHNKCGTTFALQLHDLRTLKKQTATDWFVQVAACVFPDIRPPLRLFPQRTCSAKGFNPNICRSGL